MPNWKLTDQYGANYPALKNSILSELVFSDHTLNGTNFSGDIDVVATGNALATAGALLGVQSIAVSGNLTDKNNTLTVALQSTDSATLTQGLVNSVPLIGKLFSSVVLDFQTKLTNDAGAIPADVFDLSAQLTVGSHKPTLSMQIPINGGYMIIDADPDLSIQLSDLGQLLSGKNDWPDNFPSDYSQGPALSLLHIAVNLYVNPQPFSAYLVSVTAAVGITGLPIIPDKLYLNPLGVWMTVANPTGSAELSYGLEGKLALTNYQHPDDLTKADFILDFAMDLKNFAISGKLEAPPISGGSDGEMSPPPAPAPAHSVNTLLKDLFGGDVSIGLPETLQIDQFDFEATTSEGKVSDFSFDVAMSGGFGLFQEFDIESFSVSLRHTVDSSN